MDKHGSSISISIGIRSRAAALACVLALSAAPQFAAAATCEAEDYDTRVSGIAQCLLMRRFGVTDPELMIVWLHGDVSDGGPANYHFTAAQQANAAFAERKVMSVALVRPGYPDGTGNASSVAALHGGRSDHYTKENLDEVGAAVQRLRARFSPKRVVVVGHSGGAATAAALLGMQPALFDAAVLVACPCDLVAWRSGRRPWSRSENPLSWASRVAVSARVIALTGARDDNTPPALAIAYVDALRARGVDATFVLLPGETHNGAFRSPEVLKALQALSMAK